MSFCRENVVWQSARGGWYIGFFETSVFGDDPEWDVDYNFDAFEWASGPHKSEAEAKSAWDGANPGMHTICQHPEDDRYDKMFDAWQEARKAGIARILG
jgi:hypothetical protein